MGLCRIRSFVLMVLFPFGVFDTLGSSYDFVIDLLKVTNNEHADAVQGCSMEINLEQESFVACVQLLSNV